MLFNTDAVSIFSGYVKGFFQFENDQCMYMYMSNKVKYSYIMCFGAKKKELNKQIIIQIIILNTNMYIYYIM